MKLVEHADYVSRTVDNGRLVEVIGLGTTTKGMTFPGRNVRKNARVPKGAMIGYTLSEQTSSTTTLTLNYHRPGQVYETTYEIDKPFEEAAKYWEIDLSVFY